MTQGGQVSLQIGPVTGVTVQDPADAEGSIVQEPFEERVRQSDMHITGHSFFRNYTSPSLLGVESRIGGIRESDGYGLFAYGGGYRSGYPASIFGSWEPHFKGFYEAGPCYHPFTLYPAAKEIAYLLKCRDLPDTDFWKVAEDEWKKQMEAIQKTVDAKETKKTSIISEIYQLVGLAAAFQGLLITATAQLSTSNRRCGTGLWWFIALSAFATIVTATGVNYKVGLVRVFQKSLDSEKPLLLERKRLLRKLTDIDGPGFDLEPFIPKKTERTKFEAFVKDRISPKLEYSTFILVALTVFGVICGFALAFICKY